MSDKQSAMSTATRGRPRAFDRGAALDAAMELFWARGFVGTSIHALTAAMGITASSLYAAFGDKRQLFDEAVGRYGEEILSALGGALDDPVTSRAASRFLHEAVSAFTAPGRPKGCLINCGAVNGGPESDDVADSLRTMRLAGRQAIRDRIAQGIAAGDTTGDPDVLAEMVATIERGIAMAARDDADPAVLHDMVDQVLAGWPAGPQSPRRRS